MVEKAQASEKMLICRGSQIPLGRVFNAGKGGIILLSDIVGCEKSPASITT
jgi:hypothetical protein